MIVQNCLAALLPNRASAPQIRSRQIGIRQRSLRKHCRLGRATELVFVTALGTAVMIGGGADAQNVTYTDGQDNAAAVDSTGGILLMVNGTDAATQSGIVSGTGSVNKDGTGTLTLSGANTYTGTTQIFDGTLIVTGSIASSLIGMNFGTRLIVDGYALSDSSAIAFDNSTTLQLTANATVGRLIDNSGGAAIELGANMLTLAGSGSNFIGTITGTGGVTVTGGTHNLVGTNNFTGAINVTGGTAGFDGAASTNVNVSGGTLSGRLNTAATLTISDNGAFRNGNPQTIASVTQSGPSLLSGDHDLTISGVYDLSGGSVTNTATITAGSLVMSGGSINSGATVNSAGAKTLSGGTIAGTLGGAGATSVTGTVALTGSITGGTTTLSAGGRLNVGASGSISSNVAFAGGQLHATGNSSLAFGDLTVGAGQTGVISAADGQTLSMQVSSLAARLAGSTLTFGEAGGTGVVEFSMPDVGGTFATDITAQTQIAGGTVKVGTAIAGLGLFSVGTTSVNSGATLDMNGFNTAVSNLSGAGTMTSGVAGAATLTLGAQTGTSSTFSGQITNGAGTVSLRKSGAGTTILSGANTYTGTTTISQGTLQIGGGGTTGSLGTGNVVNNANLTFNRSNEMTVANVISGTGGITQAGSGTTILSGNNSYSGVTNVNSGTLRITNSNALGTTAGGTVVADGATLQLSGGVTTSEDLTLSGTGVGGGGALHNASGANVVNGAITVNGDTLLRNNTGLYSQSLTLNGNILGANHDLSFSGNSLIDINGNVATGSGGIIKTGTGRLVLGGNNTFTGDVQINQGDLWATDGNSIADTVLVRVANGAFFRVADDETVGNVTGAGNVEIGIFGSTRHLTLGDATDAQISGVVSGSNGSLTKQGSGTLTLSGVNTYGGTTTINAGRLAVDGSITSASTINSGGTLGGTGTVGAVTVNTGGTLAAGNSIGTLTTGDVTFGAGSTLEVEVDPSDDTRADLIASTGSVTINGGTLRHVGPDGSYDPRRTWRVVTATGGVTGSFDDVISNYTFLDASATYGAGFVDLTLTRNNLSFASIAQTRNQRATAGGLEGTSGSEVYNAFVTLSGDTARNALDQLSGAGVATSDAGLVDHGQGMAGAVIRQISGGNSSRITQSTRGAGTAQAGGHGRTWATGFGAASRRDLEGIGTDFGHQGLMVGRDLDMGEWQGGVMGAAGTSTTTTTGLNSSTSAKTYSLGLYAQRSIGGSNLRFGLIGTRADVSSTRGVAVGGLNQTLSANYQTRMLTGFAEVSHDFKRGAWTASPFLRLTHQRLQNDGFTETGGSAALTRNAQTTSQTEVTLGGHVARDIQIGTLPAQISGYLAATRQFGSAAQSSYQIAGSGPFSIEGNSGDGSRVDLGLGLNIQLTPKASLALFAAGSRQNGETAARLGANFNLRF